MEKESLQYLEKLFKEYQATLGLTTSKNEMFSNQNYLNYLEEMRHDLTIYKRCLLEGGILNQVSLELGKGVLDSISEKDMPIILLTNYKKTFEDIGENSIEDKREILKGTLEANPKGIEIKINNSSRTLVLLRNNHLYCATQNPFDYKKTVNDLKFLYNQGFNVVLGIYGKIKDKNQQNKLFELKKFQNLVSGNLIVRNVEDTYVAYVKSKNNAK